MCLYSIVYIRYLKLKSYRMLRGMSGLDLASLGIPSDKKYLEEYCANTGIGDVDTWNFYLSFAFFRIAAILQGVYKRSLQSKTIILTSSFGS